MNKPEKYIVDAAFRDYQRKLGYNQACEEWEKYHEWYVRTHCKEKEEENFNWIEETNRRMRL